MSSVVLLLFALVAGALSQEATPELDSCTQCKNELMGCMGKAYRSPADQAATNTFLGCAASIWLTRTGESLDLSAALPGRVERALGAGADDRQSCVLKSVQDSFACFDCLDAQSDEPEPLEVVLWGCEASADEARQLTTLLQLRDYLAPARTVNAICGQCRATVGLCEELKFVDVVALDEASDFTVCVRDRRAENPDHMPLDRLLGGGLPKFLNTSALAEVALGANEGLDFGRSFCLDSAVFSEDSVCIQCLGKFGERGAKFMENIEACTEQPFDDDWEDDGEGYEYSGEDDSDWDDSTTASPTN